MCSSLRRLDLTYVIQTHRIRKKKRCESDDVLLVELLIVCPLPSAVQKLLHCQPKWREGFPDCRQNKPASIRDSVMPSAGYTILLATFSPLAVSGFGTRYLPNESFRRHSARGAASTADTVIRDAGDRALSSVQWFGSLVSKNANQNLDDSLSEKDSANIDGTGGSVYSNLASTIDADENKERQVWAALANLEKDSKWKCKGAL